MNSIGCVVSLVTKGLVKYRRKLIHDLDNPFRKPDIANCAFWYLIDRSRSSPFPIFQIDIANYSMDTTVQDQVWTSLVDRSIEEWRKIIIATEEDSKNLDLPIDELKRYKTLDEFLLRKGSLMFWFFQRRERFLSQKRIAKWDRQALDNHIILPASSGFVLRSNCFFVSHFWRTAKHPDPKGQWLRLSQKDLRQIDWSYVWVDWTCIPQHPRNDAEDSYFAESLAYLSGLIRNCGLAYRYSGFEPRMWILYELTEYTLTCDEWNWTYPRCHGVQTTYYRNAQYRRRTSPCQIQIQMLLRTRSIISAA